MSSIEGEISQPDREQISTPVERLALLESKQRDEYPSYLNSEHE